MSLRGVADRVTLRAFCEECIESKAHVEISLFERVSLLGKLLLATDISPQPSLSQPSAKADARSQPTASVQPLEPFDQPQGKPVPAVRVVPTFETARPEFRWRDALSPNQRRCAQGGQAGIGESEAVLQSWIF